MYAITLVTFCLYPLAWVVDTARQLRTAGGRVPSTYFYFAPFLIGIAITIIIPILNGLGYTQSLGELTNHDKIWLYFKIVNIFPLYFWFGYVSAYCQIIQHKNDRKSIWIYFILMALCLYGSDLLKNIGLLELVMKKTIVNYPNISEIIFMVIKYIIEATLTNTVFFFFFQRGYNNFNN